MTSHLPLYVARETVISEPSLAFWLSERLIGATDYGSDVKRPTTTILLPQLDRVSILKEMQSG